MLGLGYPGGPAVDKLAKTGNSTIQFPRPLLKFGYEFSFSGLKSAVSRYLDNNKVPNNADVAASFVSSAMEVLITKSRLALKKHKVQSFVIVGGVAASPQLRTAATQLCQELGVELSLPPIRWSTDNAAMIALATFDYLNLSILKEPVAELHLSISDF